jgi:hypothetical protein
MEVSQEHVNVNEVICETENDIDPKFPSLVQKKF